MHEVQSVRFDRRVLLLLNKVMRKAKNLSTYLLQQRLKRFRDEVRMRLFRFCLDRGRRVPRALADIPVRTVYLYAEKHYRPGGPIEGDLLLFRATRGKGADEPYIDRYEDPLLGWGRRVTQDVRPYDIPGGHASMLQEPHVEALADRLQSCIDEAFATRPQAPHGLQAMPSPRQSARPVHTIS